MPRITSLPGAKLPPTDLFWLVYGSAENKAFTAAIEELAAQHLGPGVDCWGAAATTCQYLVDHGHVTKEHIIAIMTLCKAATNPER